MKNMEKPTITVTVLLVFMPGCASVGDRTLKIDIRHIVGVRNMRSEITSMLEVVGYESQPVRDPVTGQPVQVAKELGQYGVLFRAADMASVQVEVHICEDNRMTGLHFSEAGCDQPGAAAMDCYRKLKERPVMEFGAVNFSDKHSLMTP